MTKPIKDAPNTELTVREIISTKWQPFAVEVEKICTAIQIVDDLTAARAVDAAKRVKTFLKNADAARKEMKEPYAEMVEQIDSAFRPLTQALQKSEAIIKMKLQAYLDNQEKLRQQEERAAQAAFEERRTSAVESAVFDGQDPEALAAITDLSVPGSTLPKVGIRSDEALASQRKKWVYEITDPSKLPPAFMMPNEKAIAAAVKAGTRAIDGVRIFETNEIAIR